MAFLKIKNMRNFSIHVRSFSQVAATEMDYNSAKPFNEIPGPKNFFTMMKMFALPGGRYYNKPLNEMLHLIREDYGNICYLPGVFGQKPSVLTFQPEDAEKVLRTEGRYPYRRNLESFEYFRKTLRPDLYKESAGLTIEQGHEWFEFRTKVNQIMMQPKNVKMYIPKIDEVTIDFIAKIRKVRDENMEMPADFIENLNELTFENIALIAFDSRLNVFEGNDPKAIRLYQLIKQMFEAIYVYDIQPSIWRYFKTPGFNKAMKTFEEGANIIFSYVDEAIEKHERNPSASSDESILVKLMKVDKNVARVMAGDMIGAGIDTTSAALTNVLYCLAKNPEKQEILRDEVFSQILPNKDSKMDIKSLDNIPYMRAVVKEALRLHPIASGNIRGAGQNLVIQNYQIPKGTDLLLVARSHVEHFEQCDKFIPERWLKDNNNQVEGCPHAKDSHPFAYLPFGFGSRMCIGKRMAEMEIEVAVARILREFRLEWNHPDLKWKSVILTFPDGPLKYKMIDL